MENIDWQKNFLITIFVIATTFNLHHSLTIYLKYLHVKKFTKKYGLTYMRHNIIGSMLRNQKFDRIYNIFYGKLEGRPLFSFVSSRIGSSKIIVNNYIYELGRFEEEKFLNLPNDGVGQRFMPKTLVEFAMYTIGFEYINNGKILDLLRMEMIIGRILSRNTLANTQCNELYKNVIKSSYVSDIENAVKDGEGDYKRAILSSVEELKNMI